MVSDGDGQGVALWPRDAEAEQGVAEYVEQTALDGGHD